MSNRDEAGSLALQSGEEVTADKIILRLREEAGASWGGAIGEERANELETFIRAMLKDYAAVLGFSEDEILTKLEEKRDYTAINYYQRSRFPPIKDVDVYETMKQLQDKFTSGKFVCPHCGAISTDPVTCNSGWIMKEDGDVPCDWKAWGLFGTLGKGYRFVVKEDFLANPMIYDIFMPMELHEAQKEAP